MVCPPPPRLPGIPLELPPDCFPLDEPTHPADVLAAVRRAAIVLFDDPDAILDEVQQLLLPPRGRTSRDLCSYFRQHFFKSHLGRYSKSRRKAPIYWYLSVPSREWGLWLYAPRISREMLFAVVREARRKEAALSDSVLRLRGDESRATGRARTDLSKRRAAEEALLAEIKNFRTEAERIAELGWGPDLDDGIILCAAPLAGLFPAWPDAATARRDIRAGKYPWASVSRWQDRL